MVPRDKTLGEEQGKTGGSFTVGPCVRFAGSLRRVVCALEKFCCQTFIFFHVSSSYLEFALLVVFLPFCGLIHVVCPPSFTPVRLVFLCCVSCDGEGGQMNNKPIVTE